MAGKISCPVQSHRKAEVFGATMIHYNLPGANWQSTREAVVVSFGLSMKKNSSDKITRFSATC
jgi:hypothetical protein